MIANLILIFCCPNKVTKSFVYHKAKKIKFLLPVPWPKQEAQGDTMLAWATIALTLIKSALQYVSKSKYLDIYMYVQWILYKNLKFCWFSSIYSYIKYQAHFVVLVKVRRFFSTLIYPPPPFVTPLFSRESWFSPENHALIKF